MIQKPNLRVADFLFDWNNVPHHSGDPRAGLTEKIQQYVAQWLSSFDRHSEMTCELFENVKKNHKATVLQMTQIRWESDKTVPLEAVNRIYASLFAACDEIAQVPADFFHANVKFGPHVVLKDHLSDDSEENLKTLDHVPGTQEYAQKFELKSKNYLEIFTDPTSMNEPIFAYQYRMFMSQCYVHTITDVALIYKDVYWSYYLDSPNTNADQIGKEFAHKIHTLASRICDTPIEGFDSPVSQQQIYIQSIEKCLEAIVWVPKDLAPDFLSYLFKLGTEHLKSFSTQEPYSNPDDQTPITVNGLATDFTNLLYEFLKNPPQDEERYLEMIQSARTLQEEKEEDQVDSDRAPSVDNLSSDMDVDLEENPFDSTLKANADVDENPFDSTLKANADVDENTFDSTLKASGDPKIDEDTPTSSDQ